MNKYLLTDTISFIKPREYPILTVYISVTRKVTLICHNISVSVICYMLHVTCYMLHVTSYMLLRMHMCITCCVMQYVV